MTREEIIEATYREGRVKKTVDHWMHYATWETRKDAMQEIWLVLCTYPEDKLQQIYTDGLMNAFITRIVRNWWCTKRSVFTIKYRRYLPVAEEDLHLPPDSQPENTDDDRMWLIKDVLANLPKEEKLYWDTYLKTGEYKETAEVLGVNWWTVKPVINRIRNKVKKALKWNGFLK